jgi:hypothetical protein
MSGLKPDSELLVGGMAATIVYSIFAINAPNLSDVRADSPENGNQTNTYKSVNTATWTAAAVTAGLALLSKSPTVFVIGGVMTLAEAWKHHFANFGSSPAKDAAVTSLWLLCPHGSSAHL